MPTSLGSTTTSSRRETAIAPLRWRQRDEVPANIIRTLRTNHETTSILSDARRVFGCAVAVGHADVQLGRAAGRPLDARRPLYLGHGRRLCAGRGDRGLRRLRRDDQALARDRKSTRLNSSHLVISYAVFCLKKKKKDKRNAANREVRDPRCVSRCA